MPVDMITKLQSKKYFEIQFLKNIIRLKAFIKLDLNKINERLIIKKNLMAMVQKY